MPGSGLWEEYYYRAYGEYPEPPRVDSDVRRGELSEQVFARAEAMLEPGYDRWAWDNSTGRPDVASPAPQSGGRVGRSGLTASGVPDFAEAQPK